LTVQGNDAGYQIRLANLNDLPILQVIEQAASQQFSEFGLDGLENINLSIETLIEAQERNYVWVITTTTQEIVGFAVVSTSGSYVHLEEIDIHPNYARQGLGRALINSICNWSKTTGFQAITLSTFRDIPWNAPYYERLGFSIIPENRLSEDLLRVQQQETDLGLPTDQRVMMCKQL